MLANRAEIKVHTRSDGDRERTLLRLHTTSAFELRWSASDAWQMARFSCLRRANADRGRDDGEVQVMQRLMAARYPVLVVGVALCLAQSSAGRAAAQHGPKVVLGPAEADSFGDVVRKSATDALSDALHMQGFNVVLFEEAKKALPRGEGCDQACGERLLQLVSADLSAMVKITGNAEQLPDQAQVTLVDSAGHHFEGAAKLRDGDVREATTRALLEARSYQLLGPGPWVRVDGTPEGADVLIDGSVVGQLPYRASIAPGSHVLVVRDAGYSRYEKTLEVPASDASKAEVRVALEPAPIEAPGAALALAANEPGQTAPVQHSRAWLAAPIAMEVLGVALATAVSVRLATGANSCVEPDIDNYCVENKGVKVWTTVSAYALSAGLIGGGIVWIVLGTQAERQPQVAANIGIDHIAVSGSF
jgi:hypothetical protein